MYDDLIDLRTDVKTLPTETMLEAMRSAELGDSKVNEDPTVLRLEEMAAARLGTEAAMLLISGTMANLCALMAHASPMTMSGHADWPKPSRGCPAWQWI